VSRASADAPDPGAITDVAGLRVGHFTDERRPTGCTVVLCDGGAVAGVCVRGGAPGTRETDLLRPGQLVEQVHALLLTGGSAFGLDAAGGVMRWLADRGIGLEVGPARVPIVPAAVLFDLWLGDPRIHPDAEAGARACEAAIATPPAQGNVGAGAGCSVGKLFGIGRAMRGGIGGASLRLGAVTVGALVAVNAIGDVFDGRGRVLAGARSEDGRRCIGTTAALLAGRGPERLVGTVPPGSATTIGVVATDARLSKAEANRLAALAHHGLARAIDPLTMADGDTLFALATGRAGVPADLTLLGVLAAEAVARAIRNAVCSASPLAGPGLPQLPAQRDFATG
jgi:L-aminopeptidase/D-esterase-like protein